LLVFVFIVNQEMFKETAAFTPQLNTD